MVSWEEQRKEWRLLIRSMGSCASGTQRLVKVFVSFVCILFPFSSHSSREERRKRMMRSHSIGSSGSGNEP